MTTFVPIQNFKEESPRETLVDWNIPQHDGSNVKMRSAVYTLDATAVVYESNFVSTIHPTGKWWESLYISASKTNSVGFSITTWGKKLGAKGSIQVKAVAETEWYDTVKSKLEASKGYIAQSYTGRKEGLTVPQSRIFRPALEGVPYSPQLAFSDAMADAITERVTNIGLGRKIAQTLFEHSPTLEFFRKASINRHDVTTLVEQARDGLSVSADHSDVTQGILNGIAEFGFDNGTVSAIKPPAPKEPEIDRSEVYGAWGAFG